MPERTQLHTGRLLLRPSAAGSFHTVVVSASAEQALRAFDLGVLDAELVLRDGHTELSEKSLERLEALLPLDFVRIHRSIP